MANSVLKIQQANSQDIKKLIGLNEDYKVGLRLYLVYLVSLGHSSRKLSEFHDISFKQITNWVHRFEEEGLEGLKDKEGRGRRSQLTDDQLGRIRKLVLDETPEKYGLNETRWTGPLLAKWIKKEYGVDYQKAQIYKLLKNMGIAFEAKAGLVEKDIDVY